MTSREELLDRLEKATGPSYALECAIGEFFGYPVQLLQPPPNWTASVDASVALFKKVLPGWSWECRESGTGDKGQATIWNPSRSPGDNQQQRAYNCATPAIALLIAPLRSPSPGGAK